MAKVFVDYDKIIGKIKPMNAVNNGPVVAMSVQSRANFDSYRALEIPFARNHDASLYNVYGGCHTVDVDSIFPDFDLDPYLEESYDFAVTDKTVKDTFDAGTKVFYRLGSSIEHYVKKYRTLPPKDFKKWAVVCEHIIKHYTKGWANGFNYDIEYWEIWNESDYSICSPHKDTWGGTEEEFNDFYEIAAKHLKSSFPNLKIGGPAFAGYADYVDRFLCEMQKRNVPMDFISWHIYAFLPEQITQRANQFRAIMDKYGYERSESILNEWNYIRNWNKDFIYSNVQTSSIKGAAFTGATMISCQNSSVDLLMYYNAGLGSVYNGLWDFYTLEPRKTYYVFQAFRDIKRLGTQVESISDAANVYALSAIDKKGNVASMIVRYNDNDNESHEYVTMETNSKVKNAKLFILNENNNLTPITPTGEGLFTVKMDRNSIVLFTAEKA